MSQQVETLFKERPEGTVLVMQIGPTVYEVLHADQDGVSVRMAKDFKITPQAPVLELECPEITNYWFLTV